MTKDPVDFLNKFQKAMHTKPTSSADLRSRKYTQENQLERAMDELSSALGPFSETLAHLKQALSSEVRPEQDKPILTKNTPLSTRVAYHLYCEAYILKVLLWELVENPIKSYQAIRDNTLHIQYLSRAIPVLISAAKSLSHPAKKEDLLGLRLLERYFRRLSTQENEDFEPDEIQTLIVNIKHKIQSLLQAESL